MRTINHRDAATVRRMRAERPRHLRPETLQESRAASRGRLLRLLTDPFCWLSIPPSLAIALLAAKTTGLLDVTTATFFVFMVCCLLVTPVAVVSVFASRKRTSRHK